MRAPTSIPVLALLLLTPVLAGCMDAASPAVSDATAAGAPAIAFQRVHTPQEVEAHVDAFAALPGVAVDRIGASVEGRSIQRVVLGDGPLVLWVAGGHHGNEPTGTEAILQIVPLLADPDAWLPPDAPPILHALREHRHTILERVTLILVPVANPDGADRFVRENAQAQDLNRDYYAFTQPESRALRDAFWDHWPDACLDLHNKGWSDRHDFDAYAPVALAETEVQDDLMRAAWRAVHEVDAAGGFAGGPNENYRLGEHAALRQVINPTAAHPGTHDMFCSLRGAPGWTPEGALRWATGAPHDDLLPYAWGARNHAITVAAAAMEAAGLYDGFQPRTVHKIQGVLGELGAAHIVDAPIGGQTTIQVVWRGGLPLDKNLLPLAVEVEDPMGRTHLARLPHPDAFTATVRFPDGEPSAYQVRIKGPAGVPYEVRTHVVPAQPAPLDVTAAPQGLRVTNPHPWPVAAHVFDVMDPVGADGFDPAPAVNFWNGTLLPRMGVQWTLHLEGGETRLLHYPEDAQERGPHRFVAVTEDGRVATGVEGARSTTRHG